MSDQEMHFADPDWQPNKQSATQATRTSPPPPPVQPINDASAQQQTAWTDQDAIIPGDGGAADKASYTSYEAGYQSREIPGTGTTQTNERQSLPNHEGQQAGQQTRRKRSPWLWVSIALIILAIFFFSPIGEDSLLVIPRVLLLILTLSAAITFLAFVIQHGRPHTSKDLSETYTFAVGAQPRIIVKDDMGAIHVHTGDDERQVIVKVTKQSLGFLNNSSGANVQYEQNFEKNHVTIKARHGWHLLGTNSILLDITVPRVTDLDLKSEAGSITVSDVQGQMNLVNEAGSVKANEVMLRGDSRLKTSAGSITFTGSLHPTGSYSMTTDAGSVTVTLPGEASFHVDAKTDVGSINSHFPLSVRRDFPGAKARGDVGIGPHPPLKLRTDVGSINVWQG